MARPAHLMPGDIILYRNHGWVGNLIAWFQWHGTSREALEYSHIGLVLDDEHSGEMNPPKSRKFPLSEVPWDRVDVFRVEVPGQGLPVQPFVMMETCDALQRVAAGRLGQIYNYGFIMQSAGIGILARIGLGNLSRWLVTRANPLPTKQWDVCSTWAEELLTEAIRITGRPDFDLFPNLGDDRARPCDWPTSPFVVRVP